MEWKMHFNKIAMMKMKLLNNYLDNWMKVNWMKVDHTACSAIKEKIYAIVRWGY